MPFEGIKVVAALGQDYFQPRRRRSSLPAKSHFIKTISGPLN